MALILLGVVMFVFGVVVTVYSPWFQDRLRMALVERLNRGEDTEVNIDCFRLYFPLHIHLKGLSVCQKGDTAIAAGNFDGKVSLLPLLRGEVEIDHARLDNGLYRMGNRDSATMITIRAGHADLSPARVHLNPMKISVENGDLDNALVDLYINPDPPKSEKPETEASPLDIAVRRLRLRNLRYRMNLLPTIDSLGVLIADATLRDAAISLTEQTVDVGSLSGHGLNAAYIAPDSATVANTIVAPADTTPSRPWTVRVNRFFFDHSSGLYTTRGIRPQPGLDFAYIKAHDMTIAVDSFYNQATTVRIPLTLDATERCGMTVSARGLLAIDEPGITFSNFSVRTPDGTNLAADGFLGTGDLAADPDVPLRLKASGRIAAADTRLMFPVFKPYLSPLPHGAAISTDIDVKGTSGRLNVNALRLSVPDALNIDARGTLTSVMDPQKLSGDIGLRGNIGNINPWLRMFLTAKGISVIPMSLDGNVRFRNGDYSGDIRVAAAGGSVAADGYFHGRGPEYEAHLDARDFPLGSFLTDIGAGNVSAVIDVFGHGLDIFSPATHIDASIDAQAVTYHGKTYRDIAGTASMHDGHADVELSSQNPGLEFALKAAGDLDEKGSYSITAAIDGRDIDLMALKLSDAPADISLDADIDASFDRTLTDIAATVHISELDYTTDTETFRVDEVTAHLNADDSVTNASIRNRDMYAYLSAPSSFRSLMTRLASVAPTLNGMIARHSVSVAELQRALPEFRLDIDGGSDNMLTQILQGMKMKVRNFSLSASNDSLINIHARALGFATSSMRLDSISFDAVQHSDRLNYQARVGNRPGTFDSWANVVIDGFFETDSLGISMRQRNIQGKTGFAVGGNIHLLGDSMAIFHLSPLDPLIAYKQWEINSDNFISYNFRHRHIDASLRMHNDRSSLALYTEHALDTISTGLHPADEDIVLQLNDIHLQDWISINPFAPPLKGNLSADMRVNWLDTRLTGNGSVSLTDFIYGKERVGDMKADMNLLTDKKGLINADVNLFVNGVKSLTVNGALNDSTRTSPLNLDLRMIHFPLSVANPFLPGVARLTGTLNGSLDVSGDKEDIRLNGALDFDSATVRVDMIGTRFALSDVEIPVTDNLVRFNNFAITGCNENPLRVNGTVDLRHLTNPDIDLSLNASNMQIVDAARAPKGADVYGKAFINLDATARGSMSFMRVNADLAVLPGTNVTYVMPDATSAIQNYSTGEMVKFVNFSESAAVAAADSAAINSSMMLALNAGLNIMSGSTISVDLSSNGQDKVQLKSEGSLSFSMSPVNTGRLTGRLNINSGFVRYTPPMMSQKLFNFSEGSYVAFNGNMMNPLLNISAVDKVRANVTSTGQNSRLIDFDVSLDVTGSLNNMNVMFDLGTDDDATVANELATMSPSQRASAAMNLLITNVYTGPGTRADANLGGNALYSFLTSQLNSWAANTIKGVDLSFGINQYDNVHGGTSQQTTSYSYQLSKSLFNDRFKIIVGGNYNTDDNTDRSLAENLINDISVEYMLNKSGSMYVRIFRHTGYESILEGEITQTGVGFVYRRKINRIGDMFRWLPRRRHKASSPIPAPADSSTSVSSSDSL